MSPRSCAVRDSPSRIRQCPGDYKDGKLAELWRGPRTAAGEGWVSESVPERTSKRADSGSCSAANGGRGEAGHPAHDPRCPPGDHLDGAVRAAHRGPTVGGRH